MSHTLYRYYGEEVIWNEERLIDNFRTHLKSILKTEYRHPSRSPSTFFEEFYPIWEDYGLEKNSADNRYLDDKKYGAFVSAKITAIKSNANISKNKTGLDLIPPFLQWMDKHQPSYAAQWFQTVKQYYEANDQLEKISLIIDHYERGKSVKNLTHQTIDKQIKATLEKPVAEFDNAIDLVKSDSPFLLKDWISEGRQPDPNPSEEWLPFREISIPKRFELSLGLMPGFYTYLPRSLIWTRDHIHGIVQTQEKGWVTRLISCWMQGEEASFIFVKQKRRSESEIQAICAMRPDSNDFLFGTLAGLFFVSRRYSKDSHIYKNYGRVFYLSPELDATPSVISDPSTLSSDIPISERKDAIYFNDVMYSASVSPNAKICLEGRKALLFRQMWRPRREVSDLGA